MAQLIAQDELILRRHTWKRNGQSVVFASGCFDLLHPGHIRLLEQARSHGDILVVGIRSDESVRAAHAGESHPPVSSRPISPAAERAEILAALAAVDYVIEFDDSNLAALLERLAPDAVVQAGSPDRRPAAPGDSASAEGAPKIVHILLEPGYSTARLIERIIHLPA